MTLYEVGWHSIPSQALQQSRPCHVERIPVVSLMMLALKLSSASLSFDEHCVSSAIAIAIAIAIDDDKVHGRMKMKKKTVKKEEFMVVE